MKTHTFPHSPQVFPQGFSTGSQLLCMHFSLHNNFRQYLLFVDFFAVQNNDGDFFSCRKIPLDTPTNCVTKHYCLPVVVPAIFLGFEKPSSAGDHRHSLSSLLLPQAALALLPLYIVFSPGLRHKSQKNTENIVIFLKKGIDFMESLRYNWSVHEQKYLQEV